MLGPLFYENIITLFINMIINFNLCFGNKTYTQENVSVCLLPQKTFFGMLFGSKQQ